MYEVICRTCEVEAQVQGLFHGQTVENYECPECRTGRKAKKRRDKEMSK